MNIAELFVNLGIKGDDKTTTKLKSVKGGMNDVKSSSIGAKAAILAAFYGLQRLTSASMNAGVAQVQFANLTGLSTKKLQQWQYANKMAGGSAEEVAGTITGMQQAFAQLQLGEGPAKYLGLFAEGLEKVNESFDEKKMGDVFYTLEKARAFLKGGGSGNIGVDNEIISSLGISPNMLAGMRGGSFDDSVLNRARIVSDGQAKEAQRIKAMWTDLGDTVEKEIGKLNTKFGGQLVKDLTEVVKQMAFLVSEVIKLGNNLGVFDRLSKAIENVGNLANLVQGITKELNSETPKEDKTPIGKGIDNLKALYDGGDWDTVFKYVKEALSIETSMSKSQADANTFKASALAPSMAGYTSGTGPKLIGVTQNQNFYGSTDPKAAGTEGKSGVKSAFNQLNKAQ